MATYVIESYLAADRARELRSETTRLRRATRRTLRGAVRYLRSYYVPTDELAFHLLEAPTIEAVMDVVGAAAIVAERVVEAESADS